mgnify:CR=1 FL=1
MNKIYFSCMLGILAMLASCSQDEGLYSTNTVTVTATLPKKIQSRSAATDTELAKIKRCKLMVYRAGTTDAPVFSVEGTRVDNSFTFTLLMDDLTSPYDFYCWADDGGVTYDITDMTQITFKGDSPAAPGHRGEAKGESVADHTMTIHLSHVTAKVRLETTAGLSGAPIGVTTTMHTSYNALTGKVGAETKQVTVTQAGLTGLGASEMTPQKVVSFYALVDADEPNQTVHISYGEQTEDIPNVPIKADYYTTLRGNLAELGFMPYTVSASIDKDWNDQTTTYPPIGVDAEKHTIFPVYAGDISIDPSVIAKARDAETGNLVIAGPMNTVDIEAIGQWMRRNENLYLNLDLSQVTGLTEIPRYGFQGTIGWKEYPDKTYGLTSIVLPDGITTLGEYAFTECYSLTGIYTSNGIREVGTAELPEGVTFLGQSCFRFTKIEKVILPATYTTVGKSVFLSANNVTEIVFKGDVKNIELAAFDADKLTTIDFSNCSTAPTLLGGYAPSSDKAFGRIDPKAVTLKVKAGTKDSYANSELWNQCKIEEVMP